MDIFDITYSLGRLSQRSSVVTSIEVVMQQQILPGRGGAF